MAAVMDQLDDLEIGLCLRINSYGSRRWVRRFFSAVSRLGDGGYWVAMALPLIALQGSAAFPEILRIGLTTVAGVLIYKALKRKLVRERPYIANRDIRLGTPPLDRYSFPSGHTMHAASITVFLGYAEPVLLFFALPFALLVAASRVVLGLHYPSDVLVGAAVGVALASASIACFLTLFYRAAKIVLDWLVMNGYRPRHGRKAERIRHRRGPGGGDARLLGQGL